MNIIFKKNIYINYTFFKLNPIITENKPGKLVDLNIKNICNHININFNVSKCFYINDLDSKLSRGNHSNNNASEILFCLNGSFDIKLTNQNCSETLSININEGIFIDKNIWIEFYNFKDCVILAFVDIEYNDIKDSCYDFQQYINNFNNK